MHLKHSRMTNVSGNDVADRSAVHGAGGAALPHWALVVEAPKVFGFFHFQLVIIKAISLLF